MLFEPGQATESREMIAGPRSSALFMRTRTLRHSICFICLSLHAAHRSMHIAQRCCLLCQRSCVLIHRAQCRQTKEKTRFRPMLRLLLPLEERTLMCVWCVFDDDDNVDGARARARVCRWSTSTETLQPTSNPPCGSPTKQFD